MKIVFSPMCPADLEEALLLWAATEGVGLNESDTPEQLCGYLERNPNLSVVARDDGKLVGAVLCGHDGRRGYLNHLAVLPEYRHRGLGRQLVARCLAALRDLQILKCNLFVYADNEPGKGFWNACGYATREDLRLLQRGTGCVKLQGRFI
jgi:putative acetyltransferase